MTQKRSWRDWAINFVRETNACVGEVPATGLPTDMMTEDEFKMTVSHSHSAEHCPHFLNERLAIPVSPDLREIRGIDASPITEDDVARGKKTFVKSGEPLSAVDRLKRALHTYVDLIEIKEGGRLSVPQQLMKFEVFLHEFFDVKG